ncbi:MAG: MerR family transcriptional regulator [Ruminiclostridium sp.]|nr:MerR family transcriptional regulator [Ruminiclostridium sp.]
MTVNEVSRLTGLSVRTLQYYDRIGLLAPDRRTDAGYRLYDYTALEKLQQIMLFRELEFPLKEIKAIINDPNFDGQKALVQQTELLKLRRKHLDDLIAFAEKINRVGGKYMDFSAFDKTKLDEYAKRAKEQWGDTAAYKESEERSMSRTDNENAMLAQKTMELFAEFGAMRDRDPADSEVQAQVKRLQEFFCENYYNCTNEILLGLGKMYAAGGEFTENIDSAGGAGTAEFVNRAIGIYCR